MNSVEAENACFRDVNEGIHINFVSDDALAELESPYSELIARIQGPLVPLFR